MGLGKGLKKTTKDTDANATPGAPTRKLVVTFPTYDEISRRPVAPTADAETKVLDYYHQRMTQYLGKPYEPTNRFWERECATRLLVRTKSDLAYSIELIEVMFDMAEAGDFTGPYLDKLGKSEKTFNMMADRVRARRKKMERLNKLS